MTNEHSSKINPERTRRYANERVEEGVDSMQLLVQGSPETILQMTRGYFESEEWPHRAQSKLRQPTLTFRNDNQVICIVDQPPHPLGCIFWVAFGVVTLGAAVLAWMWWVMVERDGLLPQVVVTAYPAGPGKSRVTVVSAKKPEYLTPLVEWMQREFVRNKSAAEHTVADDNGIPQQIRQLAKLRYDGTITDEEFESKKKDLLNRM
jgi:hypothetical protein